MFVYVLGFCRLLFTEFVTSMHLEQLLLCHQHAFEFCGGWPQEILYDNMKQVKLEPGQWNPRFLDFCRHYGFTPKTHRVRRPRTKDKVERVVRYIKENFLNGRSFTDLDDPNAQARSWLAGTANARVHATTGQCPCDLSAQERLTPFSSTAAYRLCPQVSRLVDWEGRVHFARSRYSVPPQHAGRRVTVEHQGHLIVVRSGELVIAEHAPAARPGSFVVQPEHVQALWRQSLSTATQAPPPQWRMTFQDSVAVTDLSRYKRLACERTNKEVLS